MSKGRDGFFGFGIIASRTSSCFHTAFITGWLFDICTINHIVSQCGNDFFLLILTSNADEKFISFGFTGSLYCRDRTTNHKMIDFCNCLGLSVAAVILASISCFPFFGARGGFCNLAVIPLVAKGGHDILLFYHCVAFGAVRAFCKAACFAGCGNSFVDYFSVACLGDCFGFCVALVVLAGVGLYTFFGARGSFCGFSIVPIVTECGNGFGVAVTARTSEGGITLFGAGGIGYFLRVVMCMAFNPAHAGNCVVEGEDNMFHITGFSHYSYFCPFGNALKAFIFVRTTIQCVVFIGCPIFCFEAIGKCGQRNPCFEPAVRLLGRRIAYIAPITIVVKFQDSANVGGTVDISVVDFFPAGRAIHGDFSVIRLRICFNVALGCGRVRAVSRWLMHS